MCPMMRALPRASRRAPWPAWQLLELPENASFGRAHLVRPRSCARRSPTTRSSRASSKRDRVEPTAFGLCRRCRADATARACGSHPRVPEATAQIQYISLTQCDPRRRIGLMFSLLAPQVSALADRDMDSGSSRPRVEPAITHATHPSFHHRFTDKATQALSRG
jgi:hypothetical protein